MEQIIGIFTEWIQNFVVSNNIIISFLVGGFVIVLESILPFLPLAVFIAINVIAFGSINGFILSYIATIIGCTISFFLARKFNKIRKYKKLDNLINKFETLKFSSLVLITAVPFTPAFSINIAAGLSNMKYKKFIFILIISKLSIIYFWGFIGTTLLESITNIGVLIQLSILLLVTFILSKLVMKHFDVI